MGGEIVKPKTWRESIIGGTLETFSLKAPPQKAAERINTLITQYRAEVQKARTVVNAFGAKISSIDTSEEFFQKVPELLKARKERIPEDQKPYTLKGAQDALGEDNILSAAEKAVHAKYGAAGVTAFKQHIKARTTAGDDTAALRASSVAFAGGTSESVEDIFAQAAHQMEDEFKSRGFRSSLIELLMGLLTGAGEIQKKVDGALGRARSKY